MIYRVTIQPGPENNGVVLHAHKYDAKTGTIYANEKVKHITNVNTSVPIASLAPIAYTLIESIGCPEPALAELEDLR